MPINYPVSVDVLATNRQNRVRQPVDADDINDIARYANAIGAELGADPSGTSATVAARLGAVDATIDARITAGGVILPAGKTITIPVVGSTLRAINDAALTALGITVPGVGGLAVTTHANAADIALRLSATKWRHLVRGVGPKDGGAAMDGSAIDTVAAQRWLDERMTGALGVRYPTFYMTGGDMLIDASLIYPDGGTLQGDSYLFGSRFLLADSAHVPIFTTDVHGLGNERHVFARDIYLASKTRSAHTAAAPFPLWDAEYVAHSFFERVKIEQFPFIGLILGGGTNRVIGSQFLSGLGTCLWLRSRGAGGSNDTVAYCNFEVTFGSAVVSEKVSSDRGRLTIRECRVEEVVHLLEGYNLAASIIQANYITNCGDGGNALLPQVGSGGVYLDETSHHNLVEANHFQNSTLIDAGWGNLVLRNNLLCWPEDAPIEAYLPRSLARDPDQSWRATTAWGVSGGASISKSAVSVVLDTQGVAMRGKLYITITSTSADTHYQGISVPVAEGESYYLDVYTAIETAGTAWRLTLFDQAGVLIHRSRPMPTRIDPTGDVDQPIRFLWHNHTGSGITALRVCVMPVTTGSVKTSYVGVHRVGGPAAAPWGIVNGGMEGAFAAGIAPGWSYLAGTGTPSEGMGFSPVQFEQAFGAIVAAGTTLTMENNHSAAALFPGQPITIVGAGAAGADLATKVAAITAGGKTVTVPDAAGTTVTLTSRFYPNVKVAAPLQATGAAVATTGDTTNASPTLANVANVAEARIGAYVAVVGAGTGGGVLFSKVTNVAGSTVTMANNAQATLTGAVCYFTWSKSQRIAVAAGNSYSLQQTIPNIDFNRWYFAKQYALVESGAPGQVVCAWSNDPASNVFTQWRRHALKLGTLPNGNWPCICTHVFRPQTIVGGGYCIGINAGVATVAYFDEAFCTPILDSIGTQHWQSSEIDPAAIGTKRLVVPTFDYRIKRLLLHPLANMTAGATIKVGTPASPTKYANYVVAGTETAGVPVEITPSVTDIRYREPVLVTGTNGGTGQFVLTIEGD